MNKEIHVSVNSLRGKILNCPKKLSGQLYKLCSYRMHNYQFAIAYQNGMWDGYIRKFSKITNSFPSGLLFKITLFLKKKGFKVIVSDLRKRLIINEKDVLKNLDDFGLILRPYQIDGLITGIYNPYMVFWWATSSGKTVLFSSLIAAFKNPFFQKTLILVANKDIASQHREELGNMLSTKIGVIEEGQFNPEQITVAVINTLWQKALLKKNKKVLKYLSEVGHLILDECHRVIDSKMFKKTIEKCENTFARHGFSASPYSFTTDDIELECVTGPPISRISLSKLIKEGWISKPIIKMIQLPNLKITESNIYSVNYSKGIVENDARNELVSKIASAEYFLDKNILVLIRIIKHGKILRDLFLKKGIAHDELAYIHGSSHKLVRKEVKDSFRKGKIKVVIASQIWNEGVDIPAVDVLIKADGGGGAEVVGEKGIRVILQQLGRVLRKPSSSKIHDVVAEKENLVYVYDFFDNGFKDLSKHSYNRLETYNLEKEFDVEVVSAKGLEEWLEKKQGRKDFPQMK